MLTMLLLFTEHNYLCSRSCSVQYKTTSVYDIVFYRTRLNKGRLGGNVLKKEYLKLNETL